MANKKPQGNIFTFLQDVGNNISKTITTANKNPIIKAVNSSPLNIGSPTQAVDRLNFLKDVAQGIPRGVKSLGISLGREPNFTPKGTVEKAIYGDAPVKGVTATGRDIGNEVGGVIGNKNLGTQLPQPVAATVGTALAAGNFLPGGLGVKKGVETGIKELPKAVEKGTQVVAKANEATVANHPTIQQLDSHLAGLNVAREHLSSLGVPSNAPAVVNNAKAYTDTLKLRNETAQQIRERGSVNPSNASDKPLENLPGQVDTNKLAKATTPMEVKKVLGDTLAPDITQRVAPAIANTKDPHIVQNILDKAQGKDITPTPILPSDAIQAHAPNMLPAEPSPTNIIDATVPQTPKELPTQIPKGENAVNKTFLSTSGELSRLGESGKAISTKLSEARNTSEIGQAEIGKQIPTVLGLNSSDFGEFVDNLDSLSKGGKLLSDNPRVTKAVQEWSAVAPKIREHALKAGIETGNLGPYYFPRNYSELLKNQKGVNKLANALIKDAQAKGNTLSIGEALKQINFMKRQYSTKFGNFENSRKFDVPGFDKSKNALIGYIQGAYDKIGHAEQFGAKGEKAQELLGNIASEGHDVERATHLYQVATGIKQYDQTQKKVSSAIRSFQRTTKLGLSAALNLGQSTNTATAGGIGRTVGAFFKQLKSKDRDFIKSTGVNIDSVLNNLREGSGLAGKITDKVTAPLFNPVERLNRGTAALVGRDVADALARKGGPKALEKLRNQFDIKGDIGKELTPEQKIRAARKFVERTQFKVDPQDLPGWANSPWGKLSAQFRSFSYKQTKFLIDEVGKEAVKGNIAPLMRFLAVGSAVGWATGNLRNVLTGQPLSTDDKGKPGSTFETARDQILFGLSNVGAAGLLSGPIFLAQNAKSFRLPQYIAGTLGGPTAGTAVETATNVAQAAGGSVKALEKQAIKTIPIVGAAVSNTVLPYQNFSDKQQAYLDKLKKNGKSPEEIKANESFFTVLKDKPNKTDAGDKIKSALKAGNEDEAYKLAEQYNKEYQNTFKGWGKKYGKYRNDEVLVEQYNKNLITDDTMSRWYDSL